MAHETNDVSNEAPVCTRTTCEMCGEMVDRPGEECTRVPVGRGDVFHKNLLGCRVAMRWMWVRYLHLAAGNTVASEWRSVLRPRKDFFTHRDFVQALRFYLRSQDLDPHEVFPGGHLPVPPNPDHLTDSDYREEEREWRYQLYGLVMIGL